MLHIHILGDTVKERFNQEMVDNAGACLSLACAIHCLAMPLLVAVLPLIGLGFLASERAEFVIVIGAITLATGSLVWGVRHHRRWRAFLILVVALAFIATARTAVEGPFEIAFHSLGGVLLATAHITNRHLCKTCPVCEGEG